MTDECISPLRRRMIEDMTVRNFVVKTQTDSSAACGHAGAATCGQTGELRWATMPEMTAARIKRCFEP